MHNAPSVSYPVGRSRFVALLLGCAWVCGAGAAVLWAMQLGVPDWRLEVMGGLLVATGAFAAQSWRRSPVGHLRWDAEAWRFSANRGEVALDEPPEVALDLQRLMLLRWRERGADRWLWLTRSSRPQAWGDLRRAVHARAAFAAPVPERAP